MRATETTRKHMTPRHDAQLFSSRFGDLMDGMGSTMFTIPVANLTMEECNGSATCGMLTRFDKVLTLTKCVKCGKGKQRLSNCCPSVGYKHVVSLAPTGVSGIGK